MTIHGLFFLVLINDFELRIDDVALFACGLFCAAAWLRFLARLRPWAWTGLR